MSKNVKRSPTKGRAKRGKPLHSRKAIQESNQKLSEFFSKRAEEIQNGMSELERRVVESISQVWENQKRHNDGMRVAEEHVILLRRVLNDALGGVTRVMTIDRRKAGSTETEKAQVIDWGWYGEQLHYSDDPNTFMSGVVLAVEELEQRKLLALEKRRRDIVVHLAVRSAEKDEDELRRIYDEGDLGEHLQQFTPKGVVWEAEMDKVAPEIVDAVLRKREAARKQQEKLEESKERSILRSVVYNLLKSGYSAILEPEEQEALVASQLPLAMEWTPRMSKNLPHIVEEMQAKLRGEMEEAKEKLLEETKEFGEDAAHVIELIQSGKEDEARAAMGKLEERVRLKELEASGSPEIPDGAAVFGGG